MQHKMAVKMEMNPELGTIRYRAGDICRDAPDTITYDDHSMRHDCIRTPRGNYLILPLLPAEEIAGYQGIEYNPNLMY